MMRRRGFTILEMTISMVMMLLVTAAIFNVANDSWKVSRQMDMQSRAHEVVRLASETLNRNLTGASNVADFQPAAFGSGGPHANTTKGTTENWIYFAKPSLFDNMGEPTEYDFYLYYLTNGQTLRTVGSKIEKAYDLREYHVRRVQAGQLDTAFLPGATESAIQAASANATFSDRLVVSGIDGQALSNGAKRGFRVNRTVTHLAAASVSGGTTLQVLSVSGLAASDTLTVGSQSYRVASVDASATPKVITAQQTIKMAHPINTPITNMTTSVTVQFLSAVMGRSNDGIARVPVETRIYLRNN